MNAFKQIIKFDTIDRDTLQLFGALIEDEIQTKMENELVKKITFKCVDCEQSSDILC